MKFELIAGELINLDLVERFRKIDRTELVEKKFDEVKQEVVTLVKGDPYLISVDLYSGHFLHMGYKSEIDRNFKFDNLAKSLGAL